MNMENSSEKALNTNKFIGKTTTKLYEIWEGTN